MKTSSVVSETEGKHRKFGNSVDCRRGEQGEPKKTKHDHLVTTRERVIINQSVTHTLKK